MWKPFLYEVMFKTIHNDSYDHNLKYLFIVKFDFIFSF